MKKNKINLVLQRPSLKLDTQKRWTYRFGFTVEADGDPLITITGCRLYEGYINGPCVRGGYKWLSICTFGERIYRALYSAVQNSVTYGQAVSDGKIIPLRPIDEHPLYRPKLLEESESNTSNVEAVKSTE